MDRCPHEVEEFLRRHQAPHCPTCECRAEELQVTYKFTRPPSYSTRSSSRSIKPMYRDCLCKCHHRERSRCFYCGNLSLFQSPTFVREKQTRSYDKTFSLIDGWFRRYDMNGDGYLDLADLKKLVQHLGASSRIASIGRAFKNADMNKDGQLSFPEFLEMWHQAAFHKNDFLDATGCQGVIDIVNEYDLHPQAICTYCGSRRYPIKEYVRDRQTIKDPILCNCGGQEKIKLFLNIFDKMSGTEESPGKDKVTKKAHAEQFPVFSSNRLCVTAPKILQE